MKIQTLVVSLTINVLLLLPGRATAQGMPVYDNTNFVSLVKTLVESAKQTTQLLKTVEFLKQQKENLEKVNTVVKQLKAVREISRNNARLIQVMQNELRGILNSPYIKPDEITRVSESFNNIVENSLETMDFIDQILSNNYLKMSDAERARILKEKEEQSQEMVSEINLKTKRYKEIISFRKLQDKINNRQTSF
ncbi:conjugal transfer protein [Leeuwenhoekiella aequorea]|uniref:conjugal transfer protein n=1 Tax=Leeuwenhoekiella aequorea TaxID=283736 RepID=UPI00352C6FD2|tara:strand:- start:404 stop:985 length:582 start_codon:yes stop_codon:yes gene_type:complete